MKKYSITLVFSSWSDSCHVNIRITFSDCSLQLSQIWRRCQNFRFEVILADSRRATCRGVSTTWWRVYCVSVMDPLAWWCQSITWMCSVCLPSIVMLIGILSLLTFESLHITEPLIKSLYKVVLLWPISLPWNSEWKFSTLSRGFLLRWNCGSKLIKSYLDTSCFEPWWFIAWASPFKVIFQYCAFLLKSLKLDGFASPHLLAPYPVHYDCTIS
jgi:hypothetical protein